MSSLVENSSKPIIAPGLSEPVWFSPLPLATAVTDARVYTR